MLVAPYKYKNKIRQSSVVVSEIVFFQTKKIKLKLTILILLSHGCKNIHRLLHLLQFPNLSAVALL